MNKPDKQLLDKIEKLLNLGREGSGATEAERANANAKAQAMMQKYNLQINTDTFTPDHIELIAVPEAKPAQVEALQRALQNVSFFNYATIVYGFAWKGIEHSEVIPRENVFTYNAWLALGRQVQKGEKGVKILTMKLGEKKDSNGNKTGEKYKFFGNVTVFHISQTKGIKPEYTGELKQLV
tara:strand:- start:490 stop:1032 length:543 start_codon:yes stop_codon:yes gene_type:complete